MTAVRCCNIVGAKLPVFGCVFDIQNIHFDSILVVWVSDSIMENLEHYVRGETRPPRLDPNVMVVVRDVFEEKLMRRLHHQEAEEVQLEMVCSCCFIIARHTSWCEWCSWWRKSGSTRRYFDTLS